MTLFCLLLFNFWQNGVVNKNFSLVLKTAVGNYSIHQPWNKMMLHVLSLIILSSREKWQQHDAILLVKPQEKMAIIGFM